MSLFDTESWKERMDERWFDTGAAMAEAGAVDLVAIEDEKVTAHVTGSVGDLYVVELWAPAGEGLCTCPGFEKFGACKHQAAAVTAANDAVRRAPTDLGPRLLLAELLLFQGRFDRIDTLLDAAAQLEPAAAVGVAEFRQLLRAEIWRRQMLTEGRVPEALGEPTKAQRAALAAVVEIGRAHV